MNLRAHIIMCDLYIERMTEHKFIQAFFFCCFVFTEHCSVLFGLYHQLGHVFPVRYVVWYGPLALSAIGISEGQVYKYLTTK